MDIDLLRTYVAIVDTGSFTRAARQTFRTQSAVSMQMKRLEAQVNRTLFRKEGRSLELTDDGKRLVHHARRLLAVHDEAMASMQPDAPAFRLRLGCPDDYAASLLPRLVEIALVIAGQPHPKVTPTLVKTLITYFQAEAEETGKTLSLPPTS